MKIKDNRFNKYEIRNDHAVFFITNRKGTNFEVKVDIEDIEKLKYLNRSWQAWYNVNNDSYYIRRSYWVQFCKDGENLNGYFH